MTRDSVGAAALFGFSISGSRILGNVAETKYMVEGRDQLEPNKGKLNPS